MKTYKSKEAAMRAAAVYQRKNGGTICECMGEDTDDSGRIIGTYCSFIVTQGATEDNPLGDSWKEFPYKYTEI